MLKRIAAIISPFVNKQSRCHFIINFFLILFGKFYKLNFFSALGSAHKMIRSSKLPFLPGYSFEREVGQTRFHKSTQFEYLRGIVPYLSEADRPGFGGYPLSWKTPDTTPSIYPRRECKDLPGWLVFDKQTLTFEAYFQEALWEVDKCPYQIRKVKIYYYPEDGTIQVIEPKVDNSGMNQGVLIARQRIRFPKPMDHGFYDMVDFNIGKNVELFGRVFRIVNCDRFTRNFLNRMGIFVGDPLNYPTDPHREEEDKKKLALMGKKPRRTAPVSAKYFEFDRKVLRFYGYWDDRSSQYGYVHKLQIHFFLADDTVEVHELIPPNSGMDRGSLFLKKTNLPKTFTGVMGPGQDEAFSYLNVLPTGFLKGKSVVDPLSGTGSKTEYYKDNDLAIGAVLNVFGRKVVLVDCDEFTREYYRTKYGVDTFEALQIPGDDETLSGEQRALPPWNGIGSYEDSEGNCRKVIPKPPKRDMYKFLAKGRRGFDSHVLRFKAKMISVDSVNDDRTFVVAYYLRDDEISVYERAARNSGFTSKYFASKREVFKPDQERFVSVKPETFQKEDLWVGNVLKLEGFKFKLVSADEYCLRYMELHNQEFPKSNAKLILGKVREKLRPAYKDFVSCYLKPCIEGSESAISFCDFKRALSDLLGEDITEHEIITLARQFRVRDSHTRFNKSEIANICRTECKKLLWLGFDRFRENIQYKDPCGTGFVPEHVAVSLCKGAKIPIQPDLLDTVIKIVDRNQCGELSVEDLLSFFDTRVSFKPTTPFSHRKEFSELERMKESTDYSWVDCKCLLESIGLEDRLAEEGHSNGVATANTPPEENPPAHR